MEYILLIFPINILNKNCFLVDTIEKVIKKVFYLLCHPKIAEKRVKKEFKK